LSKVEPVICDKVHDPVHGQDGALRKKGAQLR
jgi:hypothetical protein